MRQRITEGKCRINSSFVYGKGDRGKTAAKFGCNNVSKSSTQTEFYGVVEKLQVELDELFLELDNPYPSWFKPVAKLLEDQNIILERFALDDESKEVLDWLRSALPSLSSYCYWMSNDSAEKSLTHQFPPEFALYLDEQVEQWKHFGSAKDFQRFTSRTGVKLNAIMVSIRELERVYTKWVFSLTSPSVEALGDLIFKDGFNPFDLGIINRTLKSIKDSKTLSPIKREQLAITGAVLNRLSTLLWLLAKRHEKLNNHPPRFWGGKMPEFDLEVSSK